jgi:signal transduction histidine kinase
MVLETREPLLAALTALTPHSRKIRSTWNQLLKHYGSCHRYANLLSGLHVAPQLRDLIFSDPQAYRERAERQGQDLARKAVPSECVAAAVALYVESCLPYLLSDEGTRDERTKAFAKWASFYQFFLLAGYAQNSAAERLALEERVSQTERRSIDYSVQLGEAYEKERRRLAHDLHDEIGHDLIVLKLYTEVIALDLKKGETGQCQRKLREAATVIKHALKSVRHLTFDLGPAVWSEQGFVPAVRLYAQQFAQRTGIKVKLDTAKMHAKLPAHYETALYRVLQGALSNVIAHANAQLVKIRLVSTPESVALKIEDDGRGFNVVRKMGLPRQSYGLRVMRERVELLGGVIQFKSHSTRLREKCPGTLIEAHLPLQDSVIT